MNEDYFIYYDDLDYSLGRKNFFIQKPLVRHKVSATSGYIGSERFNAFKAYLHGKNAILFYFWKKRINWLERLLFLLVTTQIITILYVRSFGDWVEYWRGIKDGLFAKKRKAF